MNAARKHSATVARQTRPGRKAILWAAAAIAMAALAIGVSVTGTRGRQEGKAMTPPPTVTPAENSATVVAEAPAAPLERIGAAPEMPPPPPESPAAPIGAAAEPAPTSAPPMQAQGATDADATVVAAALEEQPLDSGGDEVPAGTDAMVAADAPAEPDAATVETDAAAAPSALTRVDMAMATESGTESGIEGTAPVAAPATPVSRILQQPQQDATALRLESVRQDATGVLVFSGWGAPGADIRVMMKDRAIGQGTVNRSGQWWVIAAPPTLDRTPSARVQQILDDRVTATLDTTFGF